MILVLELSNHPIVIDNLNKKYRKITALNGINLKVNQGEIFGFLGPNGAGKTTTMKILLGLLKPTAGSTQLFGVNSTELTNNVRKKIGVVFEENNLYKHLTGQENLKFFASLYNVPAEKINQLLDFFELNQARDLQIKNYSKGMKQRLLIARAIIASPDLLILDEPTSGLDPASIEIIHQAIQQFKRENKTVFLSSHFMEEVERLCDRIAFINKGEIITITTPSKLKSYYGSKNIKIKIKLNDQSSESLNSLLPAAASLERKNDSAIISLPLDHEMTGNLIDKIKSNNLILSIKTEEASLHQVFIELSKENKKLEF
ncbi:MAG: ABC transporter ATP-binding protein [Halarsenatibacteraceae bacterium]